MEGDRDEKKSSLPCGRNNMEEGKRVYMHLGFLVWGRIGYKDCSRRVCRDEKRPSICSFPTD